MRNLAVYLSPLASFKLDMLLEYLEQEWGTRSKYSFLQKFRYAVDQLRTNPKSFPASQEKKNIRKYVITSQTSMYYRIKVDANEIITVSDNRQNPEKVWDEINNYFEKD